MKAILKFDFDNPDERSEFEKATKANDAYCALWDIANDIFRPARKHGYNDPALNAFLNGESAEQVVDAISLLEKKFYEILEERGIKLD